MTRGDYQWAGGILLVIAISVLLLLRVTVFRSAPAEPLIGPGIDAE